MKKAFFITALVVFTQQTLKSDMDCLNDRLYCRRYEPVCCTCPCSRYHHSYDRGRCEQCLHFRAPQPQFKLPPLQFVEQEDEVFEIE